MPSPYMQDLFSAMAADNRFDLRVFYMEMAAPDTYWGQEQLPAYASLLPGRWFWFLGGRIHYNPGALQRIIESEPDVVVIAGYSSLTSQVVLRGLRRRRVPWCFFGERAGMVQRGAVGRALRAVAQRPAMRGPAAIAAVGTRAAASYKKHCPPTTQVFNLPYCCEIDPFLQAPRSQPDDGQVRFLYCGQLIERKGVDLLLSAFLEVADQQRACTLTVIGEGPLRKSLETSVPVRLKRRVQFAGFQPVAELPRWFANADLFVLPSRHDGWGVVVNQAAAAGLALVCSDAVGAADDLIEPNVNGWVFPSGDQNALVRCLSESARQPELTSRMGVESRRLAPNWRPQLLVDRWFELCNAVSPQESRVSASARKPAISI